MLPALLEACNSCLKSLFKGILHDISSYRQGWEITNISTMPDFSTPAEHAFEEKPVENDEGHPLSTSTADLSLAQRYSIASTLDHILSNEKYKTIALQFPDDLLSDSVLVYRMLMKGLKEADESRAGSSSSSQDTFTRQCFVLGDSTYGSCCPDVLSSLHLPADLLVHYGHACLTR